MGTTETGITMVYKGYKITVCSQRDIWGISGKMIYSSVIRLPDNQKCLSGFFPSTKTLLTEAEELKQCIDREIASGNPFPADTASNHNEIKNNYSNT